MEYLEYGESEVDEKDNRVYNSAIMKKLHIFGVIIGFAVIASIAGYAAARPAGVSLAAQTSALGDAVTESFLNLWDKFGTAIFPSRSEWSVGIGTKTPSEKLSVAGTIESMSGGFKFPDGTVQQTAQLVGPQGPQGPQGDPGAQGPPGPTGQQLHLYDANGQDLGIYLYDAQGNSLGSKAHRTYMSTLGLIIPISENWNNYADISANDQPIYFDQPGCMGKMFSNAIDHYSLMKNSDLGKYFKSTGVYFQNTITYPSWIGGGACQNQPFNLANTTEVEEVFLPFFEPIAWPLYIQ